MTSNLGQQEEIAADSKFCENRRAQRSNSFYRSPTLLLELYCNPLLKPHSSHVGSYCNVLELVL